MIIPIIQGLRSLLYNSMSYMSERREKDMRIQMVGLRTYRASDHLFNTRVPPVRKTIKARALVPLL